MIILGIDPGYAIVGFGIIEKTKKAVWKEKQPKKKFKLYQDLQAYSKELKELTDGQA